MQVEPVPSTPPLGRINDQSRRVIGNGSISVASSVTKQPRCPQNRRDKPIQNEISSQCSYSARSCAPFHSVTLSGAELRGWSCCSVSSRSAECLAVPRLPPITFWHSGCSQRIRQLRNLPKMLLRSFGLHHSH